jgi:transposase InsO family protein
VPWKESHHVDERMYFVTRLARGERMTDLCQEFGISRKTGYKFWERYQAQGLDGLRDASRAPKRSPRKTSAELEQLLIEARKAHPNWGAKTLRDVLQREHQELRIPCAWTIGGILKRHGLTKTRRRSPSRHPFPSGLTSPQAPNDVWAMDYKGQFRLGSGKYCYPLTASDLLSRYLLATEALESTDHDGAREVCERVFREYGLPLVIRTDNGPPFATQGLASLSKLSAWWMRLGIVHERIEPAHPEQNGIHERMHRTLKAETTRPARANMLAQQERFDEFRTEFNERRPHQALEMKRPAEVYQHSERPLPDPLPDLTYPLHDDVLVVSKAGHIRLPRARSVFISAALAGHAVGVRERVDGRWLVTFVALDLGTFDRRTRTFQPYSPLPPGDGA